MHEPTNTQFECDSQINSHPAKINAIDQAVTNVWLWIGMTTATCLYMALYLELPDWVQFWFDPRLFAVGAFVLFAVLVAAFRGLRSMLRRTENVKNSEQSKDQSSMVHTK